MKKPTMLEFIEFIDEIIDYDKIKKEYGLSYTEIDAYISQVKAVAGEGKIEVCKWKIDEDGVYYTECEEAFFFDTGNIEENKFKFCPYCCKVIWSDNK